jgi:hypothetical protein
MDERLTIRILEPAVTGYAEPPPSGRLPSLTARLRRKVGNSTRPTTPAPTGARTNSQISRKKTAESTLRVRTPVAVSSTIQRESSPS